MFEEEDDEATGQSRLFVILSIALIGLLVLGLLGIGGVFVIRQNIEEQALASRPTPTLVIRLPESTPVSQSPSVIATNTPAPTATNTPVVQPGTGGEEAAASDENGGVEGVEMDGGSDEANTQALSPFSRPATATPEVPPEIATATEVPDTGLGAIESVALAIGLIGLFVFARRMRMGTT